MLVSNTVMCAEAQMGRKKGAMKVTERAKVFSSLICRGKIRAAIRYACEREKEGVLMPEDTDEKSGDLLFDTLKAKHPDARDIPVENLPTFESCPYLIEVEVTDENVEQAAKKLSRSAGPSGIHSISMSYWLLKFGGESARLRKSMASMVEWLANGYPPWVAYRAMTWGRLVGLVECPGVSLIGI